MVRSFSKEQLRAFIQENNLVTARDAHEAVKTLFSQLIQEMLEAELEHELGYSRYDYRNKRTDNDNSKRFFKVYLKRSSEKYKLSN